MTEKRERERRQIETEIKTCRHSETYLCPSATRTQIRQNIPPPGNHHTASIWWPGWGRDVWRPTWCTFSLSDWADRRSDRWPRNTRSAARASTQTHINNKKKEFHLFSHNTVMTANGGRDDRMTSVSMKLYVAIEKDILNCLYTTLKERRHCLVHKYLLWYHSLSALILSHVIHNDCFYQQITKCQQCRPHELNNNWKVKTFQQWNWKWYHGERNEEMGKESASRKVNGGLCYTTNPTAKVKHDLRGEPERFHDNSGVHSSYCISETL